MGSENTPFEANAVRVLVVDDTDDLRSMMRDLLEHAGYAEEAIEPSRTAMLVYVLADDLRKGVAEDRGYVARVCYY